MPLKKVRYRVWLTGDDEAGDGRLVEVTHSDMLRAETSAGRLGLSANPADNPMHAASLWVWASLVRTGDTGEKFQPFIDAHLVGFHQVKDDPEDPPTVDPTRPTEPSRSVSDSLQPSPAPPTGSPAFL